MSTRRCDSLEDVGPGGSVTRGVFVHAMELLYILIFVEGLVQGRVKI